MSGDVSDEVTVEFRQTLRLVDNGPPRPTHNLQAVVVARIYPVPKGRGKPIISLVGDDFSDAARQVAMWFENDRPTMDGAKAQSPSAVVKGAEG